MLNVTASRSSARSRLLGAACAAAALAPNTAHAATDTTLASPPLPGTIDTDGTRYLVSQATQTGATLLVGDLGGAPSTRTTRPMPAWARPHLGTSATGQPVVVYPTCRAADRGCDLRVLDLTSGADQPLPGAATRREEVEGDMDRGAAAWLVARTINGSDQFPVPLGDDAGRITYRPVGGRTFALPGPGGVSLSLDRGRILMVRRSFTDPAAGSNGAYIVDLLRVRGQRTRVTTMGAGEDFQRIDGPRFVGARRVAWGMISLSGTWLRQRPLAPGARVTAARIIRGGLSVAPLTPRSALALQPSDGRSSWVNWDEDGAIVPAAPFPIVHVRGLNPR